MGATRTPSSYDAERPGEHELSVGLGSRLGHSGMWSLRISEGSPSDPGGRRWEPHVSSMAVVRQQQEQDEKDAAQRKQHATLAGNKTKIVAAMGGLPDGETKTAIRTRTGLNPKYFDPAFAEMVQAGEAVPCQVAKSNHKTPYDGFKLAT